MNLRNIGGKSSNDDDLSARSREQRRRRAAFSVAAAGLLILMAVLAGGAAWRESETVDEVAHIGAGVSYLQKFDLRLNGEHPPLPKILAALPLILRGTHVDYSDISWTASRRYFTAYLGEWVFGEYVLTEWNNRVSTLRWSRAPMLALTLVLGWMVFVYARRLGGDWGGLLCLSVYVSTPTFLAFGPLVHTDLAVTLFSLLALWQFAEIWQNPSRTNAAIFALALAGALLSKFTAVILFFAFGAFALSTRWRSVPAQPTTKPEARVWRRKRWRTTVWGILAAAILVYVFYFVFSVKQSSDVLYLLGHDAAGIPMGRLLMPPWLYLRSALFVAGTSSRSTFLLGHSYPHGVWFYFPVVFLLKSAPGFLGLLVLEMALTFWPKRREAGKVTAVPPEFAIHWRVLWVSLVVFTGFCLLSQMDISIRHFSVPLLLITLLLAPLPRMIEQWQASVPMRGRLVELLTAALALSCLLTAVRTYPYYFPYLNALGFGRPAYFLVNDSNVDWNQSLPDVKHFMNQRGVQKMELDYYAFNDAAASLPGSELWDCQMPTAADAGQWVTVSANMILDGHNCRWLMQYEHEALAGGSMYAVHLPAPIPAAGATGGPPVPSDFRQIGGAPFDTRVFFRDLIRHPETLPHAAKDIRDKFDAANPSTRPLPAVLQHEMD
jgi:4-amino-4-deoxy-L-arabinose transferase-like glycosyltransferase